MKKILVTGGAGFIGSHLCRKLLLKGHEVICLDNLFTCDRSNIYDLVGNPKFSFVLQDITQQFWIQVDEIYNLACPNSPVNYKKNPVETMKTSVVGAMNMLELASRVKAKILQASTSRIYGDNLNFAPSEDYWGNVDPVGVESCYIEGKRSAETLFMDYNSEYGVDIKIARIFTTYGPNMSMDSGKLISSLIMRALKNEDLIILGDPSQLKSIQYVDDLVEGLLLLMKANNGFTGPVNIGNKDMYTIDEIANTVLKLIPNSKSKIVYRDVDSNGKTKFEQVKSIKTDVRLAKKTLNWETTTSLEKGLKRTIDYFKANM